jgi:hypothetical protein
VNERVGKWARNAGFRERFEIVAADVREVAQVFNAKRKETQRNAEKREDKSDYGDDDESYQVGPAMDSHGP